MRKKLRDELRRAYVGNLDYHSSELREKVDIVDGPIGVVDPRYLGYMYLSYMFIESHNSLASGFEADKSVFEDFDPQKALMLGVSMGEYDYIHRRADVSQYKHADFVVEAIDNEDFSFMKNVETYPIFTVGRWHGHDIPVRNMTLRRSVRFNNRDSLSKVECEFLYEMIHNPEEENEWVGNIDGRVQKGYSLISEEELERESIDPDFPDHVIQPLRDNHYLGKSVSVNVPNLAGNNHVMVGLSVEEGVDISDHPEFDLPNEKIMSVLRDKYDGWRMPYIVSGVGKSWGDIVVEMHIDEPQSMNKWARELRTEIPGVRSTKTFMMTQTNFNEPLTIGHPSEIYNLRVD